MESLNPQILLHEDHESLDAVACHPNQPAVAMGNRRGILKVWDYNNKVIIGRRVFETEKQIRCVTFDPQGEPVRLLNVSNVFKKKKKTAVRFKRLPFVSKQDCTSQLASAVEQFTYSTLAL